ncbi:MAG TPA: ABC transporter permease [Methylomirabilota bacterium]|nr:ABC transporter permease [Methylomirabilota bacterium]
MTAGRRVRRHGAALGAAACLGALALVALAAPWLAPRSPEAVDLRAVLRGPGAAGWLGTDDIGRDVLSRLLFAGRASLALGLGVAVVSIGLGGVLGALAGYRRGWVDTAVSTAIDALLSIPPLALAMVAAAFLQLTPWRLVLVLAGLSWTTVARLVRGQVLSLTERPFVEAARALGAPHGRVLARHLVPNLLGPVLVAGTLLVANAILIESALSFLGFGLPPPTATWGGMLHAAQIHFAEAPWLGIFPGLAIVLAVASINFLGDGLREAFDPRLRREAR